MKLVLETISTFNLVKKISTWGLWENIAFTTPPMTEFIFRHGLQIELKEAI